MQDFLRAGLACSVPGSVGYERWRETRRQEQYSDRSYQWRRTGIGLYLGAPGAFANPDAWLNGIEALLQQYDGGHAPHGLPDGSNLDRAAYAVSFLAETNGWLVLGAALLGSGVAVKERRWVFVGLLAVALATIGYFSTKPVFFERNFSHVLPIIYVGSAFAIVSLSKRWIASPYWRAAFLVSVTAVLGSAGLMNTALIRDVIAPDRVDTAGEMETNLIERFCSPIIPVGYIVDEAQATRLVRRAQSGSERLYMILDPQDRYTERMVSKLLGSKDFLLAGRHEGAFTGRTTSTLNTYFDGDRIYLVSRSAEKFPCPAEASIP